jgi:hypothetical protein
MGKIGCSCPTVATEISRWRAQVRVTYEPEIIHTAHLHTRRQDKTWISSVAVIVSFLFVLLLKCHF